GFYRREWGQGAARKSYNRSIDLRLGSDSVLKNFAYPNRRRDARNQLQYYKPGRAAACPSSPQPIARRDHEGARMPSNGWSGTPPRQSAAAKHHEAGHHEKAAHHAHTARGHVSHARAHAEEAAKAHAEEHGRK